MHPPRFNGGCLTCIGWLAGWQKTCRIQTSCFRPLDIHLQGVNSGAPGRLIKERWAGYCFDILKRVPKVVVMLLSGRIAGL